MNMKLIALSLLLLLLGAPALRATAQATAPPAQAAPSPGQLKAADTLLNSLYTEASFNQIIEQTVSVQVKSNPSLQAHETDLRAFMLKYMGWSVLRPQMAAIYAREFSVPELEEITRFYQSPVGRKAMLKMPVLMQQGMEIGQQAVQIHQNELQQLLQGRSASPTH